MQVATNGRSILFLSLCSVIQGCQIHGINGIAIFRHMLQAIQAGFSLWRLQNPKLKTRNSINTTIKKRILHMRKSDLVSQRQLERHSGRESGICRLPT
jgi:hypothetical protein